MNLIFLLNDKNEEKSKTFSRLSWYIRQLEQVFFSHYCLNLFEVQLNNCSLSISSKIFIQEQKAIPRIIEIKN